MFDSNTFKLIFINFIIYTLLFFVLFLFFVVSVSAEAHNFNSNIFYIHQYAQSGSTSRYSIGNASSLPISLSDFVYTSYEISPYRGDDFWTLGSGDYAFFGDFIIYGMYDVPIDNIHFKVYRSNGTYVNATCDVGISADLDINNADFNVYPKMIDSDYYPLMGQSSYIQHWQFGCSYFHVTEDFARVSAIVSIWSGSNYQRFGGIVVNYFNFQANVVGNDPQDFAQVGDEITNRVLSNMTQSLEDNSAYQNSFIGNYVDLEDILSGYINFNSQTFDVVDLSYHYTSYHYIWDVISNLFTSMPLILSFVITALSIGIVRFVLR